jgi:putative ABC transport system substrate-binding protein
MKRRTFIALLGGAAAWPLSVRAQQGDSVRRIGLLITNAATDPEAQARVSAFREALAQLGWAEGRNLRIETRWAAGGPAHTRESAAELIALAPEVILTSGASGAGPLLQATRSIPVVFVIVPDPVGAGFVDSLARPGSNATGFLMFEYGLSGKWLELLKSIAPGVKRVGVLRDPAITAGIGQWSAIQTAAPSIGVDVMPLNLRDAAEIERSIAELARVPNGGLIVTGSALSFTHRKQIAALAAQHRLPAVYWDRAPVLSGGLASYGAELRDQYRRAAGYVDRVLRGEKPAELPVQAPVKYELVVNLKAAKGLGLEIPSSVLARADEVIE